MDNEDTAKPGDRVESGVAAYWKAKLDARLEGTLDASMSSYVPIACRIKGEDRVGLFDDPLFNGKRFVYAFFENVDELYRTTIEDLRDYLECKEPWEDYDICVFDESLDWFVGCSHNDRIVVIGEDALRRHVINRG